MLVLSFALGFAVLGAALIAHGTPVKTQRRRAVRLCMFFAIVVSIGCVIAMLHLRFNFTPSMPLGIYRLVPLPKSAIQRGMLVAVCAPPEVADVGRRRRYLAPGPCPSDTELLLKTIAAVAGDYVENSVRGVTVNGCLLPHSWSRSYDAARRQLRPWPEAHYRLRRGQLWLYADNGRSWDSRYWGPSATADVWAEAMPLLTIVAPVNKRPEGQATAPACSAGTATASAVSFDLARRLLHAVPSPGAGGHVDVAGEPASGDAGPFEEGSNKRPSSEGERKRSETVSPV